MTDTQVPTGADFEPTTWTGVVRKKWLKNLPPEKMLPEHQPAYVASWIYVFGMLTIIAMVFAIGTGVVITLGGGAVVPPVLDRALLQRHPLLERPALLPLHGRSPVG